MRTRGRASVFVAALAFPLLAAFGFPTTSAAVGGTDSAAPRALVLEPFGAELAPAAVAGGQEIDALLAAGFAVDVYREDQVTIPVIETMGSYAVIYVESHSGLCGSPLCKTDDAFVLSGVKVPSDISPFGSLFFDGSLTEGSPDTDPGDIYLGFTSQLVRQHVARFPHNSIVFINGCDVLATPRFVQALASRGAATVLSWNKRVASADAEAAADFIFDRLARGDTVSAALAAARAVGLGSSQAEEGASLGIAGDGAMTFEQALTQSPPITATPTATPSPAPTSTPAPSPTGVSLVGSSGYCRQGSELVAGKCRRVGAPLWP